MNMLMSINNFPCPANISFTPFHKCVIVYSHNSENKLSFQYLSLSLSARQTILVHQTVYWNFLTPYKLHLYTLSNILVALEISTTEN